MNTDKFTELTPTNLLCIQQTFIEHLGNAAILTVRTMPEDEADSPRARGSLESKASQVKLGLMSNIRGLQSQSNHWLG